MLDGWVEQQMFRHVDLNRKKIKIINFSSTLNAKHGSLIQMMIDHFIRVKDQLQNTAQTAYVQYFNSTQLYVLDCIILFQNLAYITVTKLKVNNKKSISSEIYYQVFSITITCTELSEWVLNEFRKARQLLPILIRTRRLSVRQGYARWWFRPTSLDLIAIRSHETEN